MIRRSDLLEVNDRHGRHVTCIIIPKGHAIGDSQTGHVYGYPGQTWNISNLESHPRVPGPINHEEGIRLINKIIEEYCNGT